MLENTGNSTYFSIRYVTVLFKAGNGRKSDGEGILCPAAERLKAFTIFSGSA